MSNLRGKGFTIDFHLNYNVDTNKAFYDKNFQSYLSKLQKAGAERIVVHRPRAFSGNQKKRLEDMASKIHDAGMKAVLYTGVFGTENVASNKPLAQWAQRNEQGIILGYANGRETSAMMCPASPYVKEYLAPKVAETLETANFGSIFLDIPWIMKGGCKCDNCYELRSNGSGNKEIVRYGLETFVKEIKKDFHEIKIGVNSSAPGIYSHSWHGAEISNFKGLFEEYITEWTPYTWYQKPDIVTQCILNAKKNVNGEFYHASICKNHDRTLYRSEQLSSLFYSILKADALPWLCVNASREQLGVIGEAWNKAQSSKLCFEVLKPKL